MLLVTAYLSIFFNILSLLFFFFFFGTMNDLIVPKLIYSWHLFVYKQYSTICLM